MNNLPLFPLNTVLFPNMPISLHIFEERYKAMMNMCITESRPFGVVLIRSGAEVGRSAEPHAIGCMATIAQVQPLRDGRMNMVAIGQQRFTIQSLNYDQPYLVGDVTDLPLAQDFPAEPEQRITIALRSHLREYLTVLSNVGEVEFNVDKLPSTPEELAYLAATLLQTPTDKKQTLLEINELSSLIKTVYDMCRQETAILRMMLNPKSTPQHEGPFSLN